MNLAQASPIKDNNEDVNQENIEDTHYNFANNSLHIIKCSPHFHKTNTNSTTS